MGHASSVAIGKQLDDYSKIKIAAADVDLLKTEEVEDDPASTPFSDYSSLRNSFSFPFCTSMRIPTRDISQTGSHFSLIEQYDFVAQNPPERKIFVRFMSSEMWRGNLNQGLLERLCSSSKVWEQANASNKIYTSSAQSVLAEEICLDRSLSETDDTYDFGMLAEQRRALAIICLFPYFLRLRKYLTFGEGNFDGNSATVEAMINNLDWAEEYYSEMKKDKRVEMDYGDFFLNPCHILLSIVQTDDESVFDALIKNTSWEHLVNSVIDSLPLGIEVKTKVSTCDYLFETTNGDGVWYGNLAFQEITQCGDDCNKKFAPSRLFQAKSLMLGQANKGSVRMATESYALSGIYFMATLPVISPTATTTTKLLSDADSMHLVSAYLPLSSIYDSQPRALLQSVDLILFAVGSLLL